MTQFHFKSVLIAVFISLIPFGSSASETLSARDKKVEKELSLLYGETIDGWKNSTPYQPKQNQPTSSTGLSVIQDQMTNEKADTLKIPSAVIDPSIKKEKNYSFQNKSKKSKQTGKEFRIGHVVVGKDGKVNDKKSVAAFKRAAAKGDVSAQFNLGLAYENGWGVKQNLKDASLWYAKASQKEHPSALLNLGLMFYQGRGVKKDLQLALEHFRRSANLGNAIAQFNMGNAYWVGEGVTLNESIALEWFRKSAEQGYPVAQYMLGRLYVEGEGVEQNVEEAVTWYARAASQGLKEAQAALGLAYEMGYGLKSNRDEAIRWYNLAAVQGHQGAIARIKILQNK